MLYLNGCHIKKGKIDIYSDYFSLLLHFLWKYDDSSSFLVEKIKGQVLLI